LREYRRPRANPGMRTDDTRRQVSWLTAATSAFPVSQWHSDARCADYSCGGSRGFAAFPDPSVA